MEETYWILLRNFLMLILIWFSPMLSNILPTINHIGLLNLFNLEMVQIIYSLLYCYSFIALLVQIVIILYHLIKEKIFTQSENLKLHNTYGMFILFLLLTWMSYTVNNHVRMEIKRALESDFYNFQLVDLTKI